MKCVTGLVIELMTTGSAIGLATDGATGSGTGTCRSTPHKRWVLCCLFFSSVLIKETEKITCDQYVTERRLHFPF